jgi:hypothetical protein
MMYQKQNCQLLQKVKALHTSYYPWLEQDTKISACNFFYENLGQLETLKTKELRIWKEMAAV